LSSSSIVDTIFQSIGNTAELPITKFFYFSLLNFFIFFLFLKSTRFKNYLRNSQFLYSIIFFFFFCFFLVLTASSLDSLILFEFLTLCVLLYMAASSTTAGVSTGSATSNVGVNIKFNSISYVSNSFLNFFFFMFIFGVLFFFFFILFLMYFLCISRYNTLTLVLPMYKLSAFFVTFFLIVLVLKLASAPLHFWKFEVFNNTGYFQIFYYSVFYIFFFFFIFFFFIYNFNFNFFLKAAPAVQFVIVINILFIVLNTNTVFDIKHFIILSTLINSSFFLLSIFLYKELSVFYFFLFFFNYLITSFSILIYLYFYSKDFKNISNLKKKNNIYVSNFFFFIPVLSLSGVAPTVGFLSKFLFVINVWSLNYLFIVLLIVFSIVFSTIFYFQVFKNYFFFKRATFRDFFFKKKYGYETPTPAASALAVFFSIFIILVWFFFFIIIFEFLVF
jgi:NADH:ubiquinone oxidoreductase subunit 2 (subunit N)